jgi:hypothetical protein
MHISIRSDWTADDKRFLADGLFVARHMRKCHVSCSLCRRTAIFYKQKNFQHYELSDTNLRLR